MSWQHGSPATVALGLVVSCSGTRTEVSMPAGGMWSTRWEMEASPQVIGVCFQRGFRGWRLLMAGVTPVRRGDGPDLPLSSFSL